MGYQPTKEELQFVYKMILDGANNREILEEYARLIESGQLIHPVRSDDRFTKARRRELEAASAVLEENIRRRVDPVLAQRRQEHFNKLADIAQTLVNNGLADIAGQLVDATNPDRQDYLIMSGTEPEATISLNEMRERLRENLDIACRRHRRMQVIDCFVPHLKAERPDLLPRGIEPAIEANPNELIQFLGILAIRRTFEGKCPICTSW